MTEEDVDRFCDANCSWSEHHPDCKYGKPEQEPVAYIRVSKTGNVMACAKTGDFYSLPHKTLLYTTPPQRPFVGLTDDEAQWLYDNCRTPSNLIDMTEAKLKDKNT